MKPKGRYKLTDGRMKLKRKERQSCSVETPILSLSCKPVDKTISISRRQQTIRPLHDIMNVAQTIGKNRKANPALHTKALPRKMTRHRNRLFLSQKRHIIKTNHIETLLLSVTCENPQGITLICRIPRENSG